MNFPDLPAMPACVSGTMQKITALEQVKKALEQAKAQQGQRLAQQIALTEVEAPPFHEEKRAAYFAQLLAEAGAENVSIDEEGNVVGEVPGCGCGPHLVLGAHLDTVFPAGTDVHVRQEGGKCMAPGISDDALGLSGVLQVVRCIRESGIALAGRLTILGSVGEEGNGDLRGGKFYFGKHHAEVDGFISVDGANINRILKGSVGSKRYRMVFDGPGGHSFNVFGQRASATHALCRAAAKIADIQVPANPPTTFTVGVISGGTGVNAIAAHAEMQVDMRSQDNAELDKLVARVLGYMQEAVDEENARWGVTGENAVRVEMVPIGSRPAGMNTADSPVLFAARAAQDALGIELTKYSCASTDQNVPLSYGIPSTTLGGGGKEGGNHSLTEWYEPADAHLGTQMALLTVLALLGIKGETAPMLAKRG